MIDMRTDALNFLKSSELLEILEMHAELYQARGMTPITNRLKLAMGSGDVLNFTFDDVTISCLWACGDRYKRDEMSANYYNSWELRFYRGDLQFSRLDIIAGEIHGPLF